MLGRVNRVPFPASVRFGSRVSSVRSGSCLRRRATMKSATAIVVATIVMNAGNNSKKSTLVRQCGLPGFQVLVPAAGVEEHDRFVARNLPAAISVPMAASPAPPSGAPRTPSSRAMSTARAP